MEKAVAARPDPVFGWASFALYIGSAFMPFYELRPNRIASGIPLYAWDDIAVTVGLLLASAACWYGLRSGKSSVPRFLTLLSALVLSAAPAVSVGGRAGIQAGRFSPGAGFWLYAAACLLSLRWLDGARKAAEGGRSMADLLRTRGPYLLFVAALAAFGYLGFFDRFSPYMELRAQGRRFWEELLRHVYLSGVSFSTALVLGTVAAVAISRGKLVGRLLSAVAGAVQNVPSLALFGLLLPVMAALADTFPALRAAGISGIGAAPAIVALVSYAVLPIMLSGAAGLRMVDRGIRDAARGMGMKPMQVFFKVELPLALPSLAAGARTALVQTIGITTVAALIGAGGMGYFIFQGVGQAAMDMVIIGVVPIVALSFAADRTMAGLEASLARKVRS